MWLVVEDQSPRLGLHVIERNTFIMVWPFLINECIALSQVCSALSRRSEKKMEPEPKKELNGMMGAARRSH